VVETPVSGEVVTDPESDDYGLTEFEVEANTATERPSSSSMQPTAEIMNRMALDRRTKATQNQKKIQEDFFVVVKAWKERQITLAQVRTLTGDGFLRAMVMSITPTNHPQYQDAMRMLDLLIASAPAAQPRYFTKHGWFTQADIDNAGGRVIDSVDSDGVITQRIQFPIGFDDNGNQIWPIARGTETPTEQRERYRSTFAEDWYGDEEGGDQRS
jgi:hypothetical protein